MPIVDARQSVGGHDCASSVTMAAQRRL